jgi:hypothetical protein
MLFTLESRDRNGYFTFHPKLFRSLHLQFDQSSAQAIIAVLKTNGDSPQTKVKLVIHSVERAEMTLTDLLHQVEC